MKKIILLYIALMICLSASAEDSYSFSSETDSSKIESLKIQIENLNFSISENNEKIDSITKVLDYDQNGLIEKEVLLDSLLRAITQDEITSKISSQSGSNGLNYLETIFLWFGLIVMVLFLIYLGIRLFNRFEKRDNASNHKDNVITTNKDQSQDTTAELQGFQPERTNRDKNYGQSSDSHIEQQDSSIDKNSIVENAIELDDSKKINPVILDHNIQERRMNIPLFYLSTPSQDGSFRTYEMKKDKDQYSYFKVFMDSEAKASFEVVSDSRAQAQAIKSMDYVLEPVCDIEEDGGDKSINSIENIKSGQLKKQGERWVLIDKCKIRLI